MKKLIISTVVILAAGISVNLFAQTAPTVTTPTVSGDKNLRDMDIKMRSVDMERTERDAQKNDAASRNSKNKKDAAAEDRLAEKYAEIKTDYENIQVSQDAIVKAYQAKGKIDYKLIGEKATAINQSATRLNSDLFPPPPPVPSKNKKDKKDKKEVQAVEPPKPIEQPKTNKSLRDLIVDLDNAISGFVSSPMFQNLRVVDAEVSAKAKTQLGSIIDLSAALNQKAQESAAK